MLTLSLKTKMSLAVSLFVAVVIPALALSILWYFDREFKDTISRQQFTLVSALAQEIDSKILNAQQALIAVAGSAPANLAGNPLQAQKFLDAQTGMRTVFDSGIFVFSPDGRLTAASPAEPQLQGRDYTFRDYIRETIATGRPRISMPFISTQSHHNPIVMFTAPFFDAKGKMAGILTGALNLMKDNFLGKVATIKIGRKGYLYLYDTDRTLIVHHDRSRILRRDVPAGANRLFDRSIEGFEGTGETVTFRGLHALSSFKRLSAKNWILAANFPQAEAYAPVYRAKGYLLTVLIVVLFLSVLTAWLFMHHLTAPLLLFTRHVKGITSKEIESKPILISSHDEIGALAQAFNEMLAELDEQKMTIRSQKEFSENLLLNSAVPTFVLDTRHRVIIWNKACEKLTGIKAAEILGTANQWKAFYGKERPVLADFVIDGKNGDLPLNFDSYNKSPFTPDGLQAEEWCLPSNNRERYVFFDAAPVRNANGEIIAVIETVQDITKHKRAEEELEFKNVILSTQQENSIDGILVVDESNTIISFNRRFVDLWGIPHELVEAKDDAPVLRLVANRVADTKGFMARVKYIYEQKEEKFMEEILLEDGRVFDRYSAPMRGEDGKYFGRVWYFRDITDRREAERALREETAERLRAMEALREKEQLLLQQSRLAAMGEMISNISHQWRQPLNALGLTVQQLPVIYDLGEFNREFLDDSVLQSMELIQHMSRTIDGFRNYFRPDKEKVEFKVSEAIANTVSLIEDSYKNQHIGFEVVAKDDPAIYGYPHEFAQALLNILNNARDALKERGIDEPMVTIILCSEDGGAVVTIADNAGGIPDEIIGKIFDPYFTTKGPQAGTGVGLFMSKTIIEKNMGGRLSARNIANGAEFRIEI